MPDSLESSLEGLFNEGGPFEDETLAEKKQTPTAGAAADWMEPDAIALSPDDPEPEVAAGAAAAEHFDPSEVSLEPTDAPPLELDEV